MKDKFEKLVDIIHETKINCKFTIVEIGAKPLDGEKYYLQGLANDWMNK